MAAWIGLETVHKPSLESLSQDVFSGAPEIAAAAPAAPGSGKKALWAAGLLAAVLLLAAGGWYWAKQAQAKKAPPTAGQTVPLEPAATTASEAPAEAPPVQTSTTSAAADLKRGLVLYFSFDKPPKNGVVRDESGSGNDGRVVGAKWTAQGRSGGALVFSPTDCCVRVPNSESLNPAALTLAAWIKTSYADGVWRRIIDKNFSGGFALSVTGDWNKWKPARRFRGHVVFELNDVKLLSDHAINDGQWHHIVATYDGSTQLMYVDGVRQQDAHAQIGRVERNQFNLGLGGYTAPGPGDNPRDSFDGKLDEVTIFNRALSDDEISQLYESPGLPSASAPALHWIPLFDGKTLSGWFAPDPGDWRVGKDGRIVSQGPHSHLFSPGSYTNLEFKAEVQLSEGANGGMFFRAAVSRGNVKGYEAQAANTDADPRKTGSLHHFSDVLERLVPDNVWFTQHVIAVGNRIIIKLNDRIVVDYVDPNYTYSAGHLALQQIHPGKRVMYRNAMVKPLPNDEAAAWAEARKDVPDLTR